MLEHSYLDVLFSVASVYHDVVCNDDGDDDDDAAADEDKELEV